jgi:hypothetical protein
MTDIAREADLPHTEGDQCAIAGHIAECQACREVLASIAAEIALDSALDLWRRHRPPGRDGGNGEFHLT